jgi:hypothetical protein
MIKELLWYWFNWNQKRLGTEELLQECFKVNKGFVDYNFIKYSLAEDMKIILKFLNKYESLCRITIKFPDIEGIIPEGIYIELADRVA